MCRYFKDSTAGDGILDACKLHHVWYDVTPGVNKHRFKRLCTMYHNSQVHWEKDMDASVLVANESKPPLAIADQCVELAGGLATEHAATQKWHLLTDSDVLKEAEHAKSVTATLMPSVPTIHFYRHCFETVYLISHPTLIFFHGQMLWLFEIFCC